MAKPVSCALGFLLACWWLSLCFGLVLVPPLLGAWAFVWLFFFFRGAPRREGRRVKAGAPTQEPVSSGFSHAVRAFHRLCVLLVCSTISSLLLKVCASFTLLILEMLVWEKSACIIYCFWYLMPSNYVQTHSSATEFGRRGFHQRSRRRIWTHPACLRRLPPH